MRVAGVGRAHSRLHAKFKPKLGVRERWWDVPLGMQGYRLFPLFLGELRPRTVTLSLRVAAVYAIWQGGTGEDSGTDMGAIPSVV